MSGIAGYALKGLPQASLLAASFLLLSLLFPPSAWISSAVVALVVLRKGAQQGFIVIAIATVAAMALTFVALGSWRIVPILELVFWLPTVLIALVLRNSVKLDFSMLSAAALGFVGLLIMYLLHPDPAAGWLELLREMIKLEVWAEQLKITPEEMDSLLVEMSVIMPGSAMAWLVFSAIVSLLLARQWQAKLYNPGGFQTEYHGLRYGQTAALIAAAIVGLSFIFDSGFVFGLAAVVGVIYLFQGIAIAHALVKLRSMGTGWLVGMYALCALLPQTIVILGGVGLVDAWLDTRKRLATNTGAD